MELADRVALISGGASGLGGATASQFVKNGAHVAILDRDAEALASSCASLGSKALALPADVSEPSDVAAAMTKLDEMLGRVDICVNAAGIAGSGKILNDGNPLPLDAFRRVVEVNLLGAFDVMRLCVQRMARNEPGEDGERGVVINVSSGAATQGQRGQGAYSATKAGLVGLMLPTARDLAPLGIRVVSIAPGIHDTPAVHSLSGRVRKEVTNLVLYPRRMGDPQEFAALAQHIVENRYLNATVLSIDGGLRLR